MLLGFHGCASRVSVYFDCWHGCTLFIDNDGCDVDANDSICHCQTITLIKQVKNIILSYDIKVSVILVFVMLWQCGVCFRIVYGFTCFD